MKVLHIITGLTQGGAESALFRLTTYRKDTLVKNVVISMVDFGVYGDQFESAGIETHMLGMPRGRLTLKGIIKLWTLIRKIKPDIVQTWMYHADLIGGVIARLAGYPNVLWGIVHFNLDRDVAGRTTRWTAKMCALISNFIPKKIISCSVSATLVHQKIGYDSTKFLTIPLGYDLSELKRDDLSREKLRAIWGIDKKAVIFGCLARWNPQKDHLNLLKAFEMVSKKSKDVYCVMAGREIDNNNIELAGLVNLTNRDNKNLLLIGVIDHIPSIMSAIDVHVLPSLGEAFPNVVPEAMACETPCVVTDVGDAALIVGETGWVVPPGNSEALANALFEVVQAKSGTKEWEERRRRSRDRIVNNYSMERMTDAYLSGWKSLLGKNQEELNN
jgi:glycosyltransferase involved in cell wall biosynthesis